MSEAPYSPKSLAERWGIKPNCVYKMVSRGELGAFKLGGTLLRIPASEVERVEGQWTTALGDSKDSSLSSGRKAESAADSALERLRQSKQEPRCWSLSDDDMKIPFRRARE